MRQRTIETTISQLCDEVDYWKDRAEHFQNLYDEEVRKHVQFVKEQQEESMRGVGNALMFALHVQDDENGNLVMTKESRQAMAQHLKQ